MTKRRSIGERLDRAGSDEVRARILEDWFADWQHDQYETLDDLNEAIQRRDWGLASSAAGQLRTHTTKRFGALSRIIDRLTK